MDTTLNWVSLALLSALFLATADALTKRYLSAQHATSIVMVRFGIAGLLLLPLLLMQPWPHTSWTFWGWVAVLIPLEISAMLLYIRAINSSPLALTLPYLAFTPVFNTLTGFLILGETINLAGFTGILLIVSGAWILNLDLRSLNNGQHPLRRLIAPLQAIYHVSGSRIMLAVALIYSLTSVLGKAAMNHVTPAFFGPFYFVTLGVATTLLFLIHDRSALGILRRHPWSSLAIGVCMAGMVVSHFYALSGVEVAYMIAVKRVSLLFGILYGAWLFHETGLKRNLFAGMLMVFGVYLIVST